MTHGVAADGREVQKDIQRQVRICILFLNETFWIEDIEEDY